MIDRGAPPATSNGYRESAFDRAEVPLAEVPLTEDSTDDDAPAAAEKPARKKAAKAVEAAEGGEGPRSRREARPGSRPPTPQGRRRGRRGRGVAAQVEGAQQTLDALPAEAPSTEEVLEELAIEEMVGRRPGVHGRGDSRRRGRHGRRRDDGRRPHRRERRRHGRGVRDRRGRRRARGTGRHDGAPRPRTADTAEGGSEPSGSQAGGTAPIDGYDSFSIAQLRGRLRGYALTTVTDLVAYEEATRAREPYLRMLRNRLEKLEEQAVESSPLAPRGA